MSFSSAVVFKPPRHAILVGEFDSNMLCRKAEGPEHCPGLPTAEGDLVIHASTRRHGRHRRLLFGLLGDHRLCGDQKARD
jgi:hypothetical protein